MKSIAIKGIKIDRRAMTYIGMAAAAAAVVTAAVIIVRRTRRKDASEEALQQIEASVQHENLTYSPEQYIVLADALEGHLSDNGLSGGLLGVNQKGVYEVFRKLKTDDDLKRLYTAFGIRTFRKQFTIGRRELNMAQALGLLMTSGEVEVINDILSENGLNMRL